MSGLPRQRPSRVVEADGAAWRLIEAWRGRAGQSLCYLLSLEDGVAAGDDRRDRRAVLEAAERLSDLPQERLAGLVEESVPLTDTERRFADPDGRIWLAQNVGPVWAEGDVASGLTGVLFTSLEGPMERWSRASGHLRKLSDPELRASLEGARVADAAH